MLEVLHQSSRLNHTGTQLTRLLFTSLLLSACTAVPTVQNDSPFRKASTKVHESLMTDWEKRSLYVVMQEMTQILQSAFPESQIQTDVQLSYHSEKEQVEYVIYDIEIDGKHYTTSLSAKKTIDNEWEKVSAADIAKKFIWDMREAYRNYLDKRISIIPDMHEKGWRDEKLSIFIKEEQEALEKHWLTFSGKIEFAWDILRIHFNDGIYHWKEFEYTFHKPDLSH